MDYLSQFFGTAIHTISDGINVFEGPENHLWQSLTELFYKRTSMTIDKMDTIEGSKVITDGYRNVLRSVGTYENVYGWTSKLNNYHNPFTGRQEMRVEYVCEPTRQFVTKSTLVSEPNYKDTETYHGTISCESSEFTVYIFKNSHSEALDYMNKNFSIGNTYTSYKFCSIINFVKDGNGHVHFIIQRDDPDFNKGIFMLSSICLATSIVGYQIVTWLCY
jgi:hypothetical protein